MEPVTSGIICLCIFCILIYIGMPIGFAFITVGFVGFGLVRNFSSASNLIASVPYTWASSYTMVVIPLFILMGQFAYESGISEELYTAAYKWVGSRPGGIALATTIACTLFAACTGSSLASAATMGTMAIPEMKRFKYSTRLATGSVAAGGTLGILIPPSVVFIIFGIITGTSIGRLFIAGIMPGILVSISFLLYIYIRCVFNQTYGPKAPKTTWMEKLKSISGVWGMLALFIVIVGGLYVGIFTPTEAGAVGAFASFLIVVFRKRLKYDSFKKAIVETTKTTGMIFVILIGAQIFNGFLTLSGIPAKLAMIVGNLPVPSWLTLIAILALYIPLGMLMDGLPMILLTLPTIFPIITDLGFNPIWFGVLVCMMCELANITPPMGMNLYIIKGVAGDDVPLQDVLIGAAPFAFVLIVCVAIIFMFPQVVLFLPNLMR